MEKQIYRITFLFKSNSFYPQWVQTLETELPIVNTTKAAFTLLYEKYGDNIEAILNLEQVL